jgi:CRP-like cAMP-binding protein
MSLTTDRKTDLLRDIELFRGVDPAHLARIADSAVEVDVPAGRPIARQGEIGTGFYLILSGSVRVVRDGEVLARLGPGEFFGELSVLDGQPRIAQVLADEPTACLAIASWDFERLLLDEPQLTLAILRGVARRLRAVSEDHRH